MSQLLLSRGSAHSRRCLHSAHLTQGRAELLGPNSPLQSRSIFGCSRHWQLSRGTHIALRKGAALEGKREWECTAAISLWGQTIPWPGLQRHCSAPVKPEGPRLGQHSQMSPSSERSSYGPAAKNSVLVWRLHDHLPFPPGLPTLNKKKRRVPFLQGPVCVGQSPTPRLHHQASPEPSSSLLPVAKPAARL